MDCKEIRFKITIKLYFVYIVYLMPHPIPNLSNRHNITEILLEVPLNTNPPPNHNVSTTKLIKGDNKG